jgi:predicted Holliday junction resolvase-like endonuclease
MNASVPLGIVLGAAFVAAALLIMLALRLAALRRDLRRRVDAQVELWRQRDLLTARRELDALAHREAEVALAEWKAQYTVAVRQDAVQRSQAVTAGKVFEQLVPFLPDFPFNPRDARFLGSPIDLVVFDGLDADDLRRVVFVEIKTGASTLSTRERRVRDAVQAGRVAWLELRLPEAPGH